MIAASSQAPYGPPSSNERPVPVTAGMHDAVVDRREFQSGVFLNRQCVDIGTQNNRGNAGASWNIGYDSVAPDMSPIPDGQSVEKLADDGSGVRFLPAEFRIFVEHAAKLNKTML
jgi:hypothetical protein